jgi:hypothetical protein
MVNAKAIEVVWTDDCEVLRTLHVATVADARAILQCVLSGPGERDGAWFGTLPDGTMTLGRGRGACRERGERFPLVVESTVSEFRTAVAASGR